MDILSSNFTNYEIKANCFLPVGYHLCWDWHCQFDTSKNTLPTDLRKQNVLLCIFRSNADSLSLSREINMGFREWDEKKSEDQYLKQKKICRNVYSELAFECGSKTKNISFHELSKWNEHYDKHTECKKKKYEST